MFPYKKNCNLPYSHQSMKKNSHLCMMQYTMIDNRLYTFPYIHQYK